MLVHAATEHDAILKEIVNATKSATGYTFMFPSVLAPLIALEMVETSADMPNIPANHVAVRATSDGIKHITLLEWEASKETLAAAKERELQLRNEVVALFADPDKKKGTENVVLDDGCKLKMVKKLNYKLDPDLDKVETALDKIEELGPEFKLVADRLVKWSADLSVSEYNKLDELGETGAKIKATIDAVLEVKDGTPTVELVEPKAKK